MSESEREREKTIVKCLRTDRDWWGEGADFKNDKKSQNLNGNTAI